MMLLFSLLYRQATLPLAAPSSSAFSDWQLVAPLHPVSQLRDRGSVMWTLFFILLM